MLRHASAFLIAALIAASGPASAAPTPAHAAACVAALQVDAERLAQQLREGNAEVEPELVTRLQQGFAFIGTAYKQGVEQAEADRLLKAAQSAQASLPPAELAARQAACSREGAELLKNANMFERAFVNRAAQRRIDKLKRAG